MSRYRKRPVVIEAFQMTRERRADNRDWPAWLNKAWQLDRGSLGAVYPTEEGSGDGTISIRTLEGEHLVSWEDFIILGIEGELYPCKPGIFEKTYAPDMSTINEISGLDAAIQDVLECAFEENPPKTADAILKLQQVVGPRRAEGGREYHRRFAAGEP